jgi:Anti-sigma factor NepR
MGERQKSEEKNEEKSDEMKNRKTNLEAVEPDSDKPEGQNPMGRPPHKPEVRLGREAQARIGEQLRAMYNAFVNQGVPPHLAELVRRLSEEE